MMRISVAGILLGLLLAFVSTTGGAEEGEHVTLPGAVWSIIPPPDFNIVTEPIAAFRHPSGAIILLQDSPRQPLTKADFEMDPSQAADMRVDEVTEVTADGKHGFFTIVHLASRQATSVMLTVEGVGTNGNIIAVIPDKAASAVSLDAVRKAVLSAVERPKSTDERLADLPYKLGEAAGMRVVVYIPGGALSLTDGPLDDLEIASDQSFAILSTVDAGGATFDPSGELGAMVQRIKQEYPDAQMLSSQVLETPDGNIAEIRYERTTKTSRLIVGGVTWAKPLGRRAVIMICQHPRGDEAAFARLQLVRDGLRVK
jgi:hypothetical protein